MPRGEQGSSPRKRAAATDLHERLSKDELIKRLKVSISFFFQKKKKKEKYTCMEADCRSIRSVMSLCLH